MSKRRLNIQQSARVEKKQLRYRQSAGIDEHSSTKEGLVITRFSRHALIESEDASRIQCSIRPNIDSLVAGDRIVWQALSPKQGVILSRYPRQSVLGRPDQRGQIKPVAANISQIMIVIAAKPEISWPLLDSYLVMAEYLNLKACIVLNKIDLPCEHVKARLIEQYEPLGYAIIMTSVKDTCGDTSLKHILDHETSVFVGQSGVGKSSLISSILPTVTNIQTEDISVRTALGKHTTSSSILYHIPTGGALIDSPGVREFGLWHMPDRAIAMGYLEFRPYLSQCKFRDCNHKDTMGCALIKALEMGLISKDRHDNFIKISTQFAQ